MKEQCRFCRIAENDISEKYDHPFLESSDFYSIVTIGAMIKGWHLIVPKAHACSMKCFYQEPEFIKYINNELQILWKTEKSIIAFEHGPNQFGSKTACGTNHAHIHIVPNCESLIDAMYASKLKWLRCKPNDIADLVGAHEYLFYTELNRETPWKSTEGYLCILETETSQFFRKLIAQNNGNPDQFDYKVFSNLEIVQESVIYLKKLFETREE